MDDKLTPRTAINRGPVEEPIELDPMDPEYLQEAGGDSAANDMDANRGGASATAGLDSGGAVDVRRGLSVGRAGAEYANVRAGETDNDDVRFLDESGNPIEEELTEGYLSGELGEQEYEPTEATASSEPTVSSDR